MIVGVLAFVVALLASVMLHEAGHFAFARRFGMKATEFFVGFGPKLWSTRRGETEYGVKAIPAGGYVKILGMTDLEEVAPEDEPRAFYRQPARRRAVVLAAGSVTHFLLGWVLVAVVLLGIGLPVTTLTVGSVSPCVPTGAETACAAGAPTSPAAHAGLRAGDTVRSLDGRTVTSWEELTGRIRAAGGRPVTLGVERAGQQLTLRATPALRQRPSVDDPAKTERVGVLGLSSQVALKRAGLLDGVRTTTSTVGALFSATFSSLAQIPAAVPKLVSQTFGGQQRSADGLVGPVGIARVSGQTLGAGDQLVGVRVGQFLLIIAGLNIFVGVFNLLPLLPLDGGHLAVLVYEQARARLYRLLRRPDPGRVDLTRLMPAAYLFLLLIVGLSVLLLVADIVNPVSVSF